MPDLFYYSVGDISGKFTLNPDGTINQLPYNNVKITPFLGSDGRTENLITAQLFEVDNQDRIIGFTIEDETGRIFTFNDLELSNNIEWSPLFNANSNIPTSLFGDRATSWNISNIEQVANGEKIDFTYEDVGFDSNIITTNHDLVEGSDCNCKQPTASTTSNNSNTGKILKSISWEHGQINFTLTERQDIKDDKHYSRMDIKLKTAGDASKISTVKSYEFLTDYYNSSSTDAGMKRLKLTGLRELGIGEIITDQNPILVYCIRLKFELFQKIETSRSIGI